MRWVSFGDDTLWCVVEVALCRIPGCTGRSRGNRGDVFETRRRCVLLCPVSQVKAGTLSVGSEVVCKVDYERRANVAPNHTMTHVLNFALRKVGWMLIQGNVHRMK